MKTKNLFWGLMFLLAAALVLLNMLGVIVGISIWKLAGTIAMAFVILHSLPRLEFFGIFVPLAGICALFHEDIARILGLTGLLIWPLFVVAVFLSIGLHIIFSPQHKKAEARYGHKCHHMGSDTQPDENLGEDEVRASITFGSATKYIQSKNLRNVHLSSSFGSLKVYFDQAELSPDGASVNIEASFSGIELYIPHNWVIKENIVAVLGGVTPPHRQSPPSGPVLTLNGHISFSGVKIMLV